MLAVVAAFLLLTSVIGVSGKYFGIRSHIETLEKEQTALQRKQDHLKSLNEYLATPEGQEQALRDKYNVVKPGEGMIIVTVPTATPETVVPKKGVSKWWDDILHGLGIRN